MIKCLTYFTFGILISFSSCKTVKIPEGLGGDASYISRNDLMEAIEKKEVQYSTAEVKKFTAEYSSTNEKRSFKGFLRYSTNKKLMASVAPAMGIEIFRVLADMDTLGFIDRYNKQYYRGNYDFIKRKLGMDLDFQLLNFMVTGDVKQLPKVFQPGKSFKFSMNGNYGVLSKTQEVNGTKFLVEYNYDSSFLLHRVYLQDFTNNNSIELIIRDYFKEGLYFFPKSLTVNGNSGRKLLSLNLNYKSVVFNKQLNFPFSVSSKYSEISN